MWNKSRITAGFMRLLPTLLKATACSVLVACGAKSTSLPDNTLTVSIVPQKVLLQHILGDSSRYTINCLFEDSGNPETFDPSVSDLKAVATSRAYFAVGTLPFEDAIVKRLEDSGSNISVTNTSKGIELLYGTHGAGEPDPHVWMTPGNAKTMARNMTAALTEIDPGEAHRYQQNLQVLEHKLDSLDALIRQEVAKAPGQPFMVLHPAVSYPAQEYGMMQIPLATVEGKEASAAEVRRRMDTAQRSGASVIAIENEGDRQKANVLIKGNPKQIKVVVCNPMSKDWLQQFTRLAKTLCN